MTLYVANGFSINMLDPEFADDCRISCRAYKGDLEKDFTEATSIVGHADLAHLLGVPCNRATVQLKPDDQVIVAQYRGPRLPEGTTELPEGARIEYYFVIFV